MKIYGSPGSTCTERVLFMLAEKGQEAPCTLVNLATGEHKRSPHLDRQPFGVIPVLEDDDGFLLYESRAILRYLEERFPAPSLTPAGVRERAMMAQWMSVDQSYLGAAGLLRRNLVYGRFIGLTPDMAEVERARTSVAQTFDVYERALAGREWLAGSFSLAEVSVMPDLESIYTLPLEGATALIDSRPRLRAWFERIRSRPAWQRVLADKQAAQAAFMRKMAEQQGQKAH